LIVTSVRPTRWVTTACWLIVGMASSVACAPFLNCAETFAASNKDAARKAIVKRGEIRIEGAFAGQKQRFSWKFAMFWTLTPADRRPATISVSTRGLNVVKCSYDTSNRTRGEEYFATTHGGRLR